MPDKNKYFQILALDGGGIKGLFSAALLAKLEEDLKFNITDSFDLITGTSTGGIIALGLGLGMRPQELVEFYVKKGKEIFHQTPVLSDVRQFWRNKYDNTPLVRALKDGLGEHLLGESTKRLVIPSYNLGANDVYLFKTPHHPRLKRDLYVPAWKVALATSSAPTYFPACNEVDALRLIDGGVWANNPALVGVTEALGLLEQTLTTLKVFSIGTSYDLPLRKESLDTGGFITWRQAATDIIMQGQSQGVDKQISLLLPDTRYLRTNPTVPHGLFALDRLSFADLMGHAAHVSRILAPKFERQFANHEASNFTPCNDIKKEIQANAPS